jgi:hypothetical protein
MAPTIARADRVGRDELTEFLTTRHHALLVTARRDGGVQTSGDLRRRRAGPDHGVQLPRQGQGDQHPARRPGYRVRALRRMERAVGAGGRPAEVVDLPEALDGLVEYYRCISGEHPDWDGYRRAMVPQGKCLIRLTLERWGPIATGGFPPDRAPTAPDSDRSAVGPPGSVPVNG